MILIIIVLPLDFQGRIACYLHTADAKKIARYRIPRCTVDVQQNDKSL